MNSIPHHDGESQRSRGRSQLTQASETAEREAADEMIVRYSPGARVTSRWVPDRGYDAATFVADVRARN
jgi:hypothetical protein